MLCALVLACSKKEALETARKPAASAAPAVSAEAAPRHSAAAPSATQAARPAPPIEPVVARWNELHRARDAKGLAEMYADTVEFYGEKLPKERVLALKRAAFKQAPDYTQSISKLKVSSPAADRARAEFTKSWTQGGKSNTTGGVLELALVGAAFKVTKETDGPSEMRRAAAVESACGGAVLELLSHTEDVQNYLTVSAHTGLHLAAEPPEQPTYSVSVYDEHPEGWDTLAWFDVDPKTGGVQNGSGQRVEVDPKRAQKVVDACKDS